MARTEAFAVTPGTYEECGCCGSYHKVGWSGDCRSDDNRYELTDLMNVTNGNLKRGIVLVELEQEEESEARDLAQLSITCTGKGYGRGEEYLAFGNEAHEFESMDDAKAYCRERYGKCKRSPMYIDGKDGKAVKVGYIYGFRADDMSHYPVNSWLQQDWVEFRQVRRGF